MKRILLSFVAGALGALAALAEVAVTMSPVEGSPGEELFLSVSVANDVALSGLQLAAELDNVVAVVDDSAETCGRGAQHSIVAASDGDGHLRILLFSTDMTPIAPGSGEVARIKIRLGYEPAALSVQPEIKATDLKGEILAASVKQLNVTVMAARAEYPSGPVYDFGGVSIRSRYTLDIPVRNTGTSPLEVESVQFSSSDYESESALPFVLAPGATGALKVAYFPMRRGATSNTVTIYSNSISGGSATLRLLAEPYAVNELHVGSASGVCDSEVTVPLTVKNMDPVSGFTIEFDLPEQLEYVDGSFALDDSRVADHALSISASGRRLQATAYSLSDSPFAGNDGEIASFKVRLNGRDDIYLRPSKVVLAATVDDGEVENVLSACHGTNISISYPSISVSDRLSMGRSPVTKTTSRSLDVYNYGNAPLTIERISADGDIDVAVATQFPMTVENGGYGRIEISHDAEVAGRFSGRLLLYSNDPDKRLAAVNVDYERYEPNSFTYQCEPAKGGGVLYINLDNYTAIYGMQFDVKPVEGFSLGVPQTVERASEWTCEVRTLGSAGDEVRIFCFPLGGGSIAPGEGPVLAIPYTYDEGTPNGNYNFRVAEVRMSNVDMSDCCSILGAEFPVVTVDTTLTGVDSPGVDSPAAGDVYTIGGIRLKDAKNRRGFIIVNGKAVISL